MKIKKCVGAIIYNNHGKIFLMTSGKWHGKYVVPGGEIIPGESEEEALRREIREELNIEITDIQKINEKTKKPSTDFIEKETAFHFFDFIARAKSTDITPNHEIDTYDWFDPEYARDNLKFVDATRDFVEEYIAIKKQED